MPRRGEVDPAFDGHLERRFDELGAAERLDWIWATMQILLAGEQQRASRGSDPHCQGAHTLTTASLRVGS